MVGAVSGGVRVGLAVAVGALLLGLAVLTASLAPPAAAKTHAVKSGGPCTISRPQTDEKDKDDDKRQGAGPAATARPTPLDGICEYLAGREGVVEVALFDKHDRARSGPPDEGLRL